MTSTETEVARIGVMMIPRSPRLRRFRESRNTSADLALNAALWLMFCGNLARIVFNQQAFIRQMVGRGLTDAGCGILLLAGAFCWARVNRARLNAAVHLSGKLFFVFALLAVAQGMMVTRDWTFWVQEGVCGLLSVVAIFLAAQLRDPEKLIRTLAWQLLIAVVVAGYIIVYSRPATREEWYMAGDTTSVNLLAVRALCATPFLLAYTEQLSLWQGAVVILALIETAILHIYGVNRGGLLVSCVILPALSIIIRAHTRTGFTRTFKALQRVAIGFIVLALLVSQLNLIDSTFILDRFNMVMARFGIGDFFHSTAGDVSQAVYDTSSNQFFGEGSRIGETRELLSQTSGMQWLIGRGVGGTWVSRFSPEWMIVHIGPAYLLMIGGLPLSAAFLVLILSAITNAWRQMGREMLARGAFMFLVVYIPSFLQHGPLTDEMESQFVWVCIGLASLTSGAAVLGHRTGPGPRFGGAVSAPDRRMMYGGAKSGLARTVRTGTPVKK